MTSTVTQSLSDPASLQCSPGHPTLSNTPAPRGAPTSPGAQPPSGGPAFPEPFLPAERNRTPWEICLDYAKSNAKGEVEVWKDEMDNLLIFASLFSGVAGAFSVESYRSVKQDPADTTVLLLRSMLALQLNATHPQPQTNIPIDLDPRALVTPSARRINIYNFLSLILSLSVVMTGILCLQWLREYNQDPSGIPRPRRDHLGIRCMRNEGMETWKVFTVLKTLPLILLLSLLLFFAGIIELLLGVDRGAAIVASVVIGIAAAFMVITTVLPTFLTFRIRWVGRHRFSQCPWKSPQAWVFYQIIGAPLHLIASAISTCLGQHPSDETKEDFKLRDWSVYDWLVYKTSDIANIGFGVHWLGTKYLQEKQLADALYQCIQDPSVHTSLQDVLRLKNDPRRVTSFHRQTTPTTSSDEATQALPSHLANVTVFHTLAHLAEKIERGHPPTILLDQRLDLFFKINDIHPDKDIDCPLVGDMDQRVLNSPDMRQKLLCCIYGLMSNEDVGINESHLAAVEHVLDLEANSLTPNVPLFDEALEVLNAWIDRNANGNNGNADPSFRTIQERGRQLENHASYLKGLVVSRQQARSRITSSSHVVT